jgi:hypothetical protein
MLPLNPGPLDPELYPQEIYNEQLYDLLDISTLPHELAIHENTRGQVWRHLPLAVGKG